MKWDDEKKLLEWAKKIIGKTFDDLKITKHNKNKGSIGQQVEKKVFKLKTNSKNAPDFEKLGIELKVTPIKINKNKSISPKERLQLMSINFKKHTHKDYKESPLYKKTKKILMIYYVDNEKKKEFQSVFIDAFLWEPWVDNESILKEDYEKIISLIEKSKAHKLSGKLTKFLEASPAGKNSESFSTQLDGPKARKRKFAFKGKFMKMLLESRNLNVRDIPLLSREYDKKLAKIANHISNWSVNQIIEEYNLNIKAKHILNLVMKKIIPLYDSNYRNYKNKQLSYHCIRINERNKIKENLSLPYQGDFSTWLEQNYENSLWKKYLENREFIFFIFKKDRDGNFIFHGFKRHSLTQYEINQFKITYEKVRAILKSGIEIQDIKGRKINNLPTKKQNKVWHVRPKSRKASYEESSNSWKIPNAKTKYKWMTKQTFWINNSWLEKILLD